MLKSLVAAALLTPMMVFAEEWVPLFEDAEIEAALADRVVRYDALTFQRFGADGDTQYMTERASEGRWAARGGQYCSVWPPSDTWTCYDFQVNGELVRFISADRSISVGSYDD